MIVRALSVLVLLFVAAAFPRGAAAISPAITYQGFLTDQGQPADGSYDFRFTLRDASDQPIGAPVLRDAVVVVRGVFSVTLDFPFPAFNGQDRRLALEVRRVGVVAYTALAPSVAVAAAPYALVSEFAEGADVAGSASLADDATLFGGRPPAEFVLQTDPRLNDARAPTAGSANYVQNQNAIAQVANFRVSGTAAAGIVSAATQYNLGATRVLSFANASVYLGEGAAAAVTSGNQNVFVGWQAGLANTSGSFNSFLGLWAGRDNTTGIGNNFYGSETGRSTTTGCCNSFFGGSAGFANQTGSYNTFIGERSAQTLVTGDQNTSVGAFAFVQDTLVNATAIGARATVLQSNSLVLGAINNINGATADTRVGIGTTLPKARLDVATGDILIGAPGAGIILKSPNGALCRKLTVDNAGALVTTAIACP